MAEAAADSDSDLDVDYNTDEYVRCPVCLDYFTEPKLLPCAHLICSGCLVNWLRANVKPATCPVCRGSITDEEVCRLPSSSTPEEVALALPTDVSMECLVDANKQLRGPHECSRCGAEANSFCLECYRKLCKKCRRKHSKVTTKKAFKAAAKRELTLLDVAGATADGASGGSLSNVPYVPPKKHRIELLASLDQQTICSQRGHKCKEHTGEDDFLDYFCVTHDASLCLQCVKEGHSQCSLITMEVKSEENRRTLQEQADKLRRQERLLREEEAKVMQKEQEAQEMAEKTREEIDNVMDGIQQGLRSAQDKLKRDIAESEKLPVEERARHQASLIRAFKDQLHDIMSLDSAEAALRRYEDYSRESVLDIHQRTNFLRGQETRAQGAQRQRQHHHHRGHQQRSHHNHQQAAAPSTAHTSALRLAAADISSAIQEVTADLQQAVLSTPSADTSPPPPGQADRNPDTKS